LKLVKGSRPDRINEDEPKVPVSIPDPPDFLEGEEIDTFIITAGKLARMRVMTEADVDALAIYAVNFVRWKDATAKLRETGPLVRSPNNFPIQSPYLAVANKAQGEMLKILSEFGLTPSSRTRVKVT
jgi:P27 family predicted phage terminase small subunit